MPRLLLVDDNQSIHKIAETLLASTDIQLTCASSGAEALDFVDRDGPFDVALLDTTMAVMDGWALLDKLRHIPATARMPIAMMAGVLDTVEPATLERAPIQGFLKKPVELRDLADRVRSLMATPVLPPAPEPAAPEPATPEPATPEPATPEPATPEPAAPELATPEPAADNLATIPYMRLSDHPLPEGDLLLLEPGDVLEEEAPEAFAASLEAPAPAGAPEVATLELEELDLDSLKGLSLPGQDEPGPEEPALEAPEAAAEDLAAIPDFAPEDTLPETAFAEPVPLPPGVATEDLPDLGPEEAAPEAPFQPVSLPSDWADESDSLLPPLPEPVLDGHEDFGPDSFLEEPGPVPTPAFVPELPGEVTPVSLADLEAFEAPEEPAASAPTESLPEPEFEAAPEPEPEPAPEAWPEAPAAALPPAVPEIAVPVAEPLPESSPALAEPVPEVAAPAAVAAPAPGGAADPLAAVLADPELMDRLAKAVVARLGDQILREVAWEILPDLAEKHRN